MVTVDPEELDRLLAVQQHDTALDRLRRLHAELPERAQLADLVVQRTAMNASIAAIDENTAGVAAEEQRLDDEARAVADRASEVETHLYDGTVSSPRELQDLQADLDQLRRRQRQLEDAELERMERREVLEHDLGEVDDERATLDAEIGKVEAGLAASEATIDGEIATELAARDALTAQIDHALVEDYERRRARNRGVGVARLVGSSCQACGLTIPAVEVDQFRRAGPGAVCTPEDCECILVPK